MKNFIKMLYNMFYKNLTLIIIVFTILSVNAQENNTHNSIIKNNNIYSLNVYSNKNVNNQPIIELDSNQEITINFDYIQDDSQDLPYKIVHCNADWKESNLPESKFIDGFTNNYITNYKLSFNTNLNYTNYSLNIPNEDIKIKKSGNYKLYVFKNDNKTDTLLIANFYVIEPITNIKARVRTCTNPRYIKTGQEVDFEVDYSNIKIFDSMNDFRTFVWQNGDQYNKKELKPIFIRENYLSFDYNEENVFDAGNEFHQFNTSSDKYIGRYIQSVTENQDFSYYNLMPSYNRHYKSYLYEKDINGNFIINANNRGDINTEADYVYVNFILAMDTPLDKDIYVYGKLSNWGIKDKYRLKYNLKIRAYTLSLLLKQGYYNYTYLVVDKKKNKYDNTFIEGSHYQTENDYYITIYLRNYSENYDRLVGFKQINSTLNQTFEMKN